MRLLHQYVPKNSDTMHIIPCHGDGLSAERMRDCQWHNSGAATAEDRLDGLIPVPQDFHKRMLLLQVEHCSCIKQPSVLTCLMVFGHPLKYLLFRTR